MSNTNTSLHFTGTGSALGVNFLPAYPRAWITEHLEIQRNALAQKACDAAPRWRIQDCLTYWIFHSSHTIYHFIHMDAIWQVPPVGNRKQNVEERILNVFLTRWSQWQRLNLTVTLPLVCCQRMDLNGDGVITLDEFLDVCSADPATLQSLTHLTTTLWASADCCRFGHVTPSRGVSDRRHSARDSRVVGRYSWSVSVEECLTGLALSAWLPDDTRVVCQECMTELELDTYDCRDVGWKSERLCWTVCGIAPPPLSACRADRTTVYHKPLCGDDVVTTWWRIGATQWC